MSLQRADYRITMGQSAYHHTVLEASRLGPKTVTGGQLIGQALQSEGVSTIFTLAGDHILPAIDVMADMNFRFIDTRHEAAAAHMADAWGKITGQPGVAMYTTPGFANAIPGLTAAMYSETPLISISGSAPLHELGRGAMQEIEQVAMAKPTTKDAWLVTDARRIPHMIAQALRVAYSNRRGPVHLTIPIDIQEQEVQQDEIRIFPSGQYRISSMAPASESQIRDAIGVLQGSKRPVVIAGSAAAYTGSGEAITRFIETTKFPIMTEATARGIVSDEHEYSYGFYDNGLNPAAKMLRDADVIVLLGMRQDIIMGYALPPTVSTKSKIVQIDPSSAEIGRNRGVDVGIVGNVEAVVDQLALEAGKHSWTEPTDWLAELKSVRDDFREELESKATGQLPIHAIEVHRVLKSLLHKDDFITFDGGDFCHLGRAYLPALSPRSWHYFSGVGMLGTAIPTAMAAKLAYPDRRSVVICGDGAFGFNAMEYDTAVRHAINITTVLGNDAAWGIDRQIQLQVYGKAVAVDLLPQRYDQLVSALGAYGQHVSAPDELPGALERALNADRPSLVNIDVERAISPRAQTAINRWKSQTYQPF